MNLIDREVRDGKPYGGVWIGYWTKIPHSEQYKDPGIIRERMPNVLPPPVLPGFEIRGLTYIYRPPYYTDHLNFLGTYGVKYIIYGRAFMVMRLMKSKNKAEHTHKKCYVGGRRVKKKIIRKFPPSSAS